MENIFIGVPRPSKYIQVRIFRTIVFKTLPYIVVAVGVFLSHSCPPSWCIHLAFSKTCLMLYFVEYCCICCVEEAFGRREQGVQPEGRHVLRALSGHGRAAVARGRRARQARQAAHARQRCSLFTIISKRSNRYQSHRSLDERLSPPRQQQRAKRPSKSSSK